MITRELVEKFADAQKIIQSIYPSLISFYAMCEKRERKGITMRLDTRTGRCPVIEYNSEFIAVITKEVLAALISVELIRLLLHHPTGRLLLPTEVCYQASNIICTRKEILNWNIAQYTQDHFPTVDDIEKEPGFNVAEDMYLERVFSILMNRIERNSQDKQQRPKDKKGKKTQQSDDAEESIGQSQDKPKNGTDKQKFRGDKESEDADNAKEDKNADKKTDKQQKDADKKKQGDKSDEKDGTDKDSESDDGENAETDEDVANGESDASTSGKSKKNSKKSKQKGDNPSDNDEDDGDEDAQDESDEDGESNEDGDGDSTGKNKSSKGKSGGKSKGKSNDEQPLDDDMQPSDGNDQHSSGNNQQANDDDEMSHFDDMEQALDKHFSRKNMKKNTESWGENGIIDQKVTNQLQREKSNLKSWGTMPADLKEMIDRANMIKMDPRAILKRFARSVFSTIPFFTRRKPSKKDTNQEWIGYMQGKTYQQRARVLFAIDSSGSMEEDQLQKAVAFVMSAIKHAEVYFCWWDCNCTTFTRLRMPKPSVELTGGGGTNPQCVLDYAKTQKMRFDGVVFITDCYFHWPKPETKEHIFILRTDDATKAPDWCKWVLSFKDIEHR